MEKEWEAIIPFLRERERVEGKGGRGSSSHFTYIPKELISFLRFSAGEGKSFSFPSIPGAFPQTNRLDADERALGGKGLVEEEKESS